MAGLTVDIGARGCTEITGFHGDTDVTGCDIEKYCVTRFALTGNRRISLLGRTVLICSVVMLRKMTGDTIGVTLAAGTGGSYRMAAGAAL